MTAWCSDSDCGFDGVARSRDCIFASLVAMAASRPSGCKKAVLHIAVKKQRVSDKVDDKHLPVVGPAARRSELGATHAFCQQGTSGPGKACHSWS